MDPDGRKDIDAIYKKYMDLALSAQKEGAKVASANLLHFLSAKGTPVDLPSEWLLSFSEVQIAQAKCLKYYEADFKAIAQKMKDGESILLNEVPDNISVIYGPFGDKGYANMQTASTDNELFYASGTFTVTAFCNVKLTKNNGKTHITGEIAFVFWDPYDWHNELGAVIIPNKGAYFDSDANLLVENGKAAPFMMRSNWSIDYDKTF